MRSGAMRERVAIQAEGETSDGMGGYVLGWSTVATVYGQVTAAKGDEDQHSDQVRDTQAYTVNIRHRADLTTKHRLLWRGKALNIRAIANRDEKRKYLTLTCEEGAGT